MKYTPDPKDTADAINRYAYHRPKDEGQTARYETIRAKAGEYAQFLLTACPKSRELATALTKLDEVMFFANASIARNE